MPRITGNSRTGPYVTPNADRMDRVARRVDAAARRKPTVTKVDPIAFAARQVHNIAQFARASEIFANKEDFHAVSPAQYEHQWNRLDEMGYMRVAEYISSGMLPWAFAQKFGVSHMVFREWWDKGPAEIIQRAQVNHAEASAVMAEMVLQVHPGSKEDAVVQTELSRLYRWRAERLGAKQFNAGKVKADTSRPLHIRISHRIPGLEHVWGRVSANDKVIEHEAGADG